MQANPIVNLNITDAAGAKYVEKSQRQIHQLLSLKKGFLKILTEQ